MVTLVTFVASCANLLIMRVLRRVYPQRILLALFALVMCLQSIWLLIYLLVSGNTTVAYNVRRPDLAEAPFAVGTALLIIPLTCLLVAVALGRPTPGRAVVRFTMLQAGQPSRQFMWAMVLLGIANVFWVAANLITIGPVSSSLMYVYRSTAIIPWLIGYCWRSYRLPLYVFGAVWLVGAVVAFGEGGRALIFFPVVYFLVGVGMSLRPRQRIYFCSVILLTAIPILMLSGSIELVRSEVRQGVAQTSADKARQMGALLLREDVPVKESLETGLERMVVWTNLVVPVLSPREVPYRGFGNLWDEIVFLNRSTLFTSDAGLELTKETITSEYGYGAASLYGYEIGYGFTVPFPAIAESWSRGGWLAGVIYCSIFALTLCAVEAVVRRILAREPEAALIMLTILGSVAFLKASENGLIYCLKNLFTCAAFWLGVYVAIRWFVQDRIFPGPWAPPPQPAPFTPGRFSPGRLPSAKMRPIR